MRDYENIKIDPIIRKVTLIGDNFSFSFTEDLTDLAQMRIFYSPDEFNTNNILEYFKEGEFSEEEVTNLNGKHFIYGFLESLGQSERCPDFLYTYEGDLKYKVERVIELEEK